MIIDEVLERDDAEFEIEDERYVDLDQLRQQCLDDAIDVQLELCIAAAEMCGTRFEESDDPAWSLDPDRHWDAAWRDLQRELWALASREGVSGITPRQHPCFERALDIFSARYRSALARWNELTADEESHECEDDMPTKVDSQRTRKKSAEAAEKTILLRIEKRLKVDGVITISNKGRSWSWAVEMRDLKRKRDWDFSAGGASDEREAASAGFANAWTKLENDRGALMSDDGLRLLEARDQVADQARALEPGWIPPGGIPETQSEAAAKEAAADGGDSNKVLGKLTHGPRRVSGKEASSGSLPKVSDATIDDLLDNGSRPPERLRTKKRKSRVKTPAQELPAAPPPAVSSLTALELVHVDPNLLRDHPHQPRVNYTGIEELAKSLQEHGQLDDAWGRRLPDGSIELIRGHRRKRAAARAGLELRVRIVECDDARALELIGVDDQEFVHFDAIAKARWYRAMLDTQGLSQRDLAAKIGVSQGDIGNHVRLLDLPEAWRQRLITGEITGTMGRILAPWSQRPAVLQAMEETLAENTDVEWTTQEWQRALASVLREVTLPCEPGAYYSGRFGGRTKKTWRSGHCRLSPQEIEEHRDELDIVDVPIRWAKGGETELRAFNVPRWLELNGNAEKRYEEQQAKKSVKGKGSSNAAPRTPAQETEKRRQLAEQLQARIEKYRIRWLQARIVERMASGEVDFAMQLRLLMYFALQSDSARQRSEELMESLRKAGGKPVKGKWMGFNEWKALASLADEPALKACLQGALERWLAHDVSERSRDIDRDDVSAIAQALRIELAKEWRCGEEFLELHTKQQLIQLMRREWKLGQAMNEQACEKANRGEVIAAIIAKDREKRLPAPNCLMGKKGRK